MTLLKFSVCPLLLCPVAAVPFPVERPRHCDARAVHRSRGKSSQNSVLVVKMP